MPMGTFVRSLRTAEVQALKRMLRSKDGRQVRRAQIVSLSSRGQKASAIAPLVGMSVPGVRLVVRNFNERGMEALTDRPRSGRPPKATVRYVVCLKQAVAKSPRAFGYVFGSWTLERLREHLGRRCNVLLNPHYLSRLMNKHGIVYRRPRHIMGHLRDPQEYQEKKEFLAFLKKTRGMTQPDSNCSTLMSVKFISTRPSPKAGPFEANAAKSPRPAVIRNAAFTAR